MNKNVKSTAFVDLKTSNSNLERLLDDKLQVGEDDLFDDYNFGIDHKKQQFSLRNNNPVSLVTSKIVSSLKKTIKGYNYEMQLIRRELTSPYERIVFKLI